MGGYNMGKKVIKDLNKFALPLLLQMVATYFIGTTDVAIVGNLSIEALNATKLISSTLSMTAGVLGAITITLNILLGNSYGKNDENKFSFEFFTSIVLSLIMGLTFLIIILFFGQNILNFLFDLDEKTLIQALNYLKPMSLYVLLQLILFAYTSSYKVLNKTKIILYISVLSSILDVGLDYIFVFGKFGLPKLGISFVGYSTIFTMILSIAIYAYFLRKKVKFYFKELKNYLRNTIIHFKSSIPLILQEIIDGSVYGLFVNMILVRLGTTDYAGYVIINTIIGILFLFKYVYGSAVLSLISVESQTPNKKNMKRYPQYASFITLVLYFVGAIFIMIFYKSVITLFTKNIEVISIIENYILLFILANSISCVSYSYKLALQAIKESKFVLNISTALDIVALFMMFITIPILKLSYIGLIITVFIIELLTLIIFANRYLLKINN